LIVQDLRPTRRSGAARALLLPVLLAFLGTVPALASYHDMQIQQAVGGVCGDPSQQAVQLRLRFSFQNLVSGKKLVAYDAAGSNPIVLATFNHDVTGFDAGDTILATTPELAAAAGITPDFTLTQRIPDSYLAAGRVTFEDPDANFGATILWSLAWGGTSYTGDTTGGTINDVDGDFGKVSGPLPFSRDQSLAFQNAASDPSSTNSVDYALSASPATLTNNAGTAKTLPACLFGDTFVTGDLSGWTHE